MLRSSSRMPTGSTARVLKALCSFTNVSHPYHFRNFMLFFLVINFWYNIYYSHSILSCHTCKCIKHATMCWCTWACPSVCAIIARRIVSCRSGLPWHWCQTRRGQHHHGDHSRWQWRGLDPPHCVAVGYKPTGGITLWMTLHAIVVQCMLLHSLTSLTIPNKGQGCVGDG